MRDAPYPDAPDNGELSRSYLVVSDTHFEWEGEDYREDVIDSIEEYSEEYDCDGLLVAGDVGPEKSRDRLLELDFDEIRLAAGNHDDWGNGEHRHATAEKTEQYGRDVTWEVELDDDRIYDMAMRHNPGAFDLGPEADEFDQKGDHRSDEYGEHDILVYGHSHIPFHRLLEDGAVAIGAGSTYQNYNCTENIPDTSFHVVTIGEELNIQHRDFETGKLLEESFYSEAFDGFEEQSSVWTWDAEHRDEERFVTN